MSEKVAHNVEALAIWRFSVLLLPGAAAERYKSSLFILLLGIIQLPKPKLDRKQKAENIFVAPPYCQCNVGGCAW